MCWLTANDVIERERERSSQSCFGHFKLYEFKFAGFSYSLTVFLLYFTITVYESLIAAYWVRSYSLMSLKESELGHMLLLDINRMSRMPVQSAARLYLSSNNSPKSPVQGHLISLNI